MTRRRDWGGSWELEDTRADVRYLRARKLKAVKIKVQTAPTKKEGK